MLFLRSFMGHLLKQVTAQQLNGQWGKQTTLAEEATGAKPAQDPIYVIEDSAWSSLNDIAGVNVAHVECFLEERDEFDHSSFIDEYQRNQNDLDKFLNVVNTFFLGSMIAGNRYNGAIDEKARKRNRADDKGKQLQ